MFHIFASVFKFNENSLLSLASCPGNDIFLLFCHLPTLFYENWPLGCSLGWMPGAVAPSAPPSARHCSSVSRQLVYGHFVYDTSSTDISSTDSSSTMTFLAEI